MDSKSKNFPKEKLSVDSLDNFAKLNSVPFAGYHPYILKDGTVVSLRYERISQSMNHLEYLYGQTLAAHKGHGANITTKDLAYRATPDGKFEPWADSKQTLAQFYRIINGLCIVPDKTDPKKLDSMIRIKPVVHIDPPTNPDPHENR